MPSTTRSAKAVREVSKMTDHFATRMEKRLSTSTLSIRTRSSLATRRATVYDRPRIHYCEDSDCSEDDAEDREDGDVAIAFCSSRKRKQTDVIGLDDSDNESPVLKKRKVVKAQVPGAETFNNMPCEVHQMIAEYLDDTDAANYSYACVKTSCSIDSSFWRKRCQQSFDIDVAQIEDKLFETGKHDVVTTAHITTEIVDKYKDRRILSRKWTCFDLGKFGGQIRSDMRKVQEEHQIYCLEMFWGLIIESNASVVRDDNLRKTVQGKNIQFIIDMVTGRNGISHVDIIDSIFNTSIDQVINRRYTSENIVSANDCFLYVIQLCLTPISLHPVHCNESINHFDMSQYQAYQLARIQPVFHGKWKQHINVRWLLHVVNFFKYHLKAEDEGLLARDFSELLPDQLPHPWVGRILQKNDLVTKPLRSHWKGAYSYMHQNVLSRLRRSKGTGSGIFTDALDANESFEDISFFFDDAKYAQRTGNFWPEEWETILNSDPYTKHNEIARAKRSSRRTITPPNTNSQPKIKHFWGSSRGAKRGHFFGRLQGVSPQNNIPGFQRITLMKFYTKLVKDTHCYDPDQIWGYEGCVLPGGSCIVGRWFDGRVEADREDVRTSGGPFMWWNVDRSDALDPIKVDEAFDFLDSMNFDGGI